MDKTITCHIIVVFAALAVCRYLELQTNMSIKKIIQIAKKVLTHRVTVKQTGETEFIETTIEDTEIRVQLEQLRNLGY